MLIKEENVKQLLKDKIDYLRKKYKTIGELPNQREINEISLLFFRRDKDPNKHIDTEMLAVSRGIAQGMGIMCMIIEP